MNVTVSITSERTGECPGFREEVDYEITITAEIDVSVHRDVYGTGDSPTEAECYVIRAWIDDELVDLDALTDKEVDLLEQEAWEIYAENQRDGAEYERDMDREEW